jgi:BirA family biotin operon repressor/biotin-[acetyl-CoA-carboxylase] ligase
LKFRLEVFDTLPSTATLLAERAAGQGEAPGLAILARRQTAGRGTHGRAWQSPPGNLHLSVLLRPTAPAREAPEWALLAAVALHDTAGATTRLKWPNDLMLGEAKAGGILTESATTADGMIDWLALGIGVNLAHAPELPGRATAALGAEPPEEFATRLLAALAVRAETHATSGFAPIRAAWMAAGPPLGAPLSIQQGVSRVNGRYEGLSPSGGLLLAVEGRVMEFHAGEVV